MTQSPTAHDRLSVAATDRWDALLALSVDVEPDWGIAGSRAVREVLPRLVELLDAHRAQATFFVVVDVAGECRAALGGAARRHEIASHGLTHRRLDQLGPSKIRRELLESKKRLEDEFQTEVLGIRCPFLRIPPHWFALLGQAGYRYDSSLGRVYPSPRNVPPWRWKPMVRDGIVELPPTTLATGLIPFSLTYMRLTAPVGEWLIPTRGGLFYMHPHELASPGLAKRLRAPLRWALRLHAGPPAWKMLERLLRRWAERTLTCRALVEQYNRHRKGESAA